MPTAQKNWIKVMQWWATSVLRCAREMEKHRLLFVWDITCYENFQVIVSCYMCVLTNACELKRFFKINSYTSKNLPLVDTCFAALQHS